jgi:ligand-binding sensor domain-containing protein
LIPYRSFIHYALKKEIIGCFFLYLLVVLNAAATTTHPIDENRFTLYTTLHGLSDNAITGIIQDEKGFIWISTANGLNRFDGYEFKKFYQTANPDGLIIDDLFKITYKNGELLIVSRKGSQVINTNTFTFTSYAIPATEPGYYFKNDAIDALTTNEGDVIMSTKTGLYTFFKNGELKFKYDKYNMRLGMSPGRSYGRGIMPLQKNLFIHFTAGDELNIYDNKTQQHVSVDQYSHLFPNLAALNGTVRHLVSSGSRKLTLFDVVNKAILFYDPQTDRIYRSKLPDAIAPEVQWNSKLYLFNDSTVMLTCAGNGLFMGHLNKATLEIQFSSKRYFEKYFCSNIFKDKEGRIWIGTQNGLLKQNLIEKPINGINIKSLSENINNKINYEITTLIRERNDLYVGNYSWEGIFVLDANDLSLKKKISFAKLNKRCNQLWHILPIAKDTLWFATQSGLVWLKCSNEHFGYVTLPEAIQSYIVNKPVTIAYRDTHGLIWLQGTWGSGLIQYNPVTGKTRVFQYKDGNNFLPIQTLNYIQEDNHSNIWVAEMGLARWNRKTDEFDTLITSYTGFNKNNIHIRTLATDYKKEIIFSNQNNGVVFFNPTSHQYQHLSSEQGLPENAIQTINALPNKIVWIASRHYLSAYDQSSQKIINYAHNDGLPLEGGVPACLYHDPIAKRMYIGYTNNFIAWTSDSILHNNTSQVPVFIDEINIAGNRDLIYPEKEIKLTHNENDLSIHLSAVNFSEIQNNQFYYRIGNTPWSLLGNTNTIIFHNMRPGKYLIEIKLSSSSTRWNDSFQKITIIITPAFWQTWWFSSIIFFVVSAITFALVRNRIITIKRTSRLNNEIAMAEMKALHAQMNPHFIFNSLNSIKEMILQNQNANASRYLSRFAQLIRMTLDHSRKNLVTLEQNIEYLKCYLEMEKIRMNDFVYSISIDETLNNSEIEIPAMLLQPLVENALWHGLKPKKGYKEIIIRFIRQHHQLRCEIEDNGIGIIQSKNEKRQFKHQSVGIENIRERIALLNTKYQNDSKLEIIDRSTMDDKKSGTLACLTLSFVQE